MSAGHLLIGFELGLNAPIELSPKNLMRHCVVVAQSGAGKSFFLGRLIEEIICKTKAKVIVFDPNSDYVKISSVNADAWKNPKTSPFFHPTDVISDFDKLWTNVGINILTNRNLDVSTLPLRVSWGGLSLERMASYLESSLGVDLVKDYRLYACLASNNEMAREFAKQKGVEEFTFEQFFDVARDIMDILSKRKDSRGFFQYPVNQRLRSVVKSQDFIRYYQLLERLDQYDIWLRNDDEADQIRDVKSILNNEFMKKKENQLLCIDLQSLENESERYLAVSVIISSLWEVARDQYSILVADKDQEDLRVPIFIVIDEAHNLVPPSTEKPLLRSVSDEIVRIAAEGRKYGLFLIVCTQRPKKLNTNVLSECDNLCSLRTTNMVDIQYLAESLGFVKESDLKENLNFKTGDVLLSGKLVDYKTVRIHASPQRTVPGGRDLSDDWMSK